MAAEERTSLVGLLKLVWSADEFCAHHWRAEVFVGFPFCFAICRILLCLAVSTEKFVINQYSVMI